MAGNTPQNLRSLWLCALCGYVVQKRIPKSGAFPAPLLPYLLDFRALCVALMSLGKENLENLRDHLLRTAMMAQRHRFDPIRLADDLSRILNTIPPDTAHGNFMKSIFVYVLSVSEVKEKDIVNAIEQLPPPLKDTVMTTYDLITTRARNEGIEKGIETGIEQGIEKGIEKGKLEGKIETILNAHASGLDVGLIANIAAMTTQEVTRILKEHGRIK